MHQLCIHALIVLITTIISNYTISVNGLASRLYILLKSIHMFLTACYKTPLFYIVIEMWIIKIQNKIGNLDNFLF